MEFEKTCWAPEWIFPHSDLDFSGFCVTRASFNQC